MKLEAEGRRAILDPPSSEIQSAVSSLSLPNRTFLILSRSRTSFLQVAITAPDRFTLEYQEGGVQQHFRGARNDFSTGEVVEILEAYRRGEDSWRKENEWRPLDVSARRDIWDGVSVFLMIAALLLIFDAALAFRRAGGDPILGLEVMEALSIACVAMMASGIIDLRKFRTMDAMEKVRAIGAVGVGVLVVAIQLIERLTAR